MIELKIDPIAKPRMSHSDIWKHRPIVDRYFRFKDALVLLCRKKKFTLGEDYRIEFMIKMPEGWSEKKKKSLDGKPHRQRPDLDNLIKAISDSLLKEDCRIYHIDASKIWWREGRIIIYNREKS